MHQYSGESTLLRSCKRHFQFRDVHTFVSNICEKLLVTENIQRDKIFPTLRHVCSLASIILGLNVEFTITCKRFQSSGGFHFFAYGRAEIIHSFKRTSEMVSSPRIPYP